jgi:hypothetical protein
MYPIRVIMRRLTDLIEPELAVEHVVRNLLCLLPHVGLVDLQPFPFAGKRELAGEVTVRVLVNHAANIVRLKTGKGPVDDDLCDRSLAFFYFATTFEIDCVGEALLGLDKRSAS